MASSGSQLPEQIDENFLLCGICCERYKNPKILPCLHSFCEPCLGKLADEMGAITCPVCRMLSHRLLRFHEYMAAKSSDPASVQPPVYCNTHQDYQVEFYCDTCNSTICLKCTAFDHSKPEHLYRFVKDAAKEFTKNLHVVIDKVKVKESEANNSKLKVQQIVESLAKCFKEKRKA
ncbi:tripartite motif-containing protein 2-like [Ptychodera flava]|uniref:tripartite motif-containing protein 2-like n=1 Tax=Ptychodera flava TaxID=63121 RepID=UPI00396A5845